MYLVVVFQRGLIQGSQRVFAVSSFCIKNRRPPYFLTVSVVMLFLMKLVLLCLFRLFLHNDGA